MKMTMLKVLTTAILIPFVLCGFAAAKPEAGLEKSAEQWLSLVDAGKFLEVGTLHPITSSRMPKEQWTNGSKAVRKTLGNVIGRKLKDAILTYYSLVRQTVNMSSCISILFLVTKD